MMLCQADSVCRLPFHVAVWKINALPVIDFEPVEGSNYCYLESTNGVYTSAKAD